MIRRSLATLAGAAFVLFAWGQARASDWYVDAVNGSNANSGTSPGQAWKTITWATQVVPVLGVQTIHVAPGTYDPALGEAFPIVMQPGFQLVGHPNRPRPALAGDPLQEYLIVFSSHANDPLPFDATSRLEHLLLVQPSYGVLISSDGGNASPTLVDLIVERCRTAAVQIVTVNGGASRPTIERLRATGAGPAIGAGGGIAISGQDSPGAVVKVRDSVLTQLSFAVFVFGWVDLELERCRMDDNAVGLNSSTPEVGTTTIEAIDCSLSRNSHSGVKGFTSTWPPPHPTANLKLVRCTVAHNAQYGIHADSFNPSVFHVELDHSIVAGNGVDLAVPTVVGVRRCLIGDGQYSGVNGTFAADPMFVDPTQSDFRLKWSSPCIDAAVVAPPPGALDLAGHARDVDGDLDLQKLCDLGAFEFRPLELAGSGKLGSFLRLEVWGPQNASSTIFWTRAGLVPPLSTPSGEFVLDPAAKRIFASILAGTSAPTTLVRHIPHHPALLGQVFAFQALTDSAASPSSRAFTNGVEVTIVP